MLRTTGLVVLFLACPLAIAQTSNQEIPLRPTRLSLDTATAGDAAAAFAKAGFRVEIEAKTRCVVKLKDVPFWEALEAVATATETRIELLEQGRRFALVKRDRGREVSSVRGPFRIVARQVNGRLDLTTGHGFQEVELLVHWEPRFPVFRIDSVPVILRAKDDLGNTLSASSASALSPVHAASSHMLPVRLLNVPRKAGSIAELAGQFTVTTSERMLPFEFKNLGKLPLEGTLPIGVNPGPVKAVLTGWQVENVNKKSYWEATLRLSYPEGMPAFQSFETWLGENKIRLITPQGVAIAPDQVEEPLPSSEMTMVYRFAAAKLGIGNPNGPGWSLVYDTPAPLVEFKVPFALKDVPLP